MTAQPPNGVTDANPGGPIVLSVKDGTFTEVRLTGEKVTVKGTLSGDGKTWSAGEHLGFGQTYTWSGTAIGRDGERTHLSGSFGTVQPKGTRKAKVNVVDGAAYGVAIPIKVSFQDSAGAEVFVKDKASVERALKVETSMPAEGAWAWLSDSAVHWRPKEYWQPDTRVKVVADLYGVSLGGGLFGANDVSASFTIGREQTVEASTRNPEFDYFDWAVSWDTWRTKSALL
ncbi:Ig-like domain-containing protein [Amycolatopsis sp. NPDC049252]|uniref:Ig-like domain-containing protein n=1 Tax=Amycolatopsis sp. NPDC049252 TaxID=3363933 RepID=UPI0037130ECF